MRLKTLWFLVISILILTTSVSSCNKKEKGLSNVVSEVKTEHLNFLGCRLGDTISKVIDTLRSQGVLDKYILEAEGEIRANNFEFGGVKWDYAEFWFSAGLFYSIDMWAHNIGVNYSKQICDTLTSSLIQKYGGKRGTEVIKDDGTTTYVHYFHKFRPDSSFRIAIAEIVDDGVSASVNLEYADFQVENKGESIAKQQL